MVPHCPGVGGHLLTLGVSSLVSMVVGGVFVCCCIASLTMLAVRTEVQVLETYAPNWQSGGP